MSQFEIVHFEPIPANSEIRIVQPHKSEGPPICEGRCCAAARKPDIGAKHR